MGSAPTDARGAADRPRPDEPTPRQRISRIAVTAVALATVAGFSLVGPAPAAFAATDTVANLSAEFAAASDGDTITLTKDLTGTAADPRVMVPTLTSVILDLNGKALKLIGPTNLPGMWVPNGSRLTIHDSGVGGSLSATGGQAGAGIGGGWSGNGAAVTIGSGATVTASAASQIAIGPGFNAAVFGSLSNNGSLGGAGAIQNDGIILNLGTIGAPANVSVHNVTVALDGNGGTTPASPTGWPLLGAGLLLAGATLLLLRRRVRKS